MEHTGFELPLSGYEKGFLTAHFEAHLRFEDYRCQGNAWYEHLSDANDWIGVGIGNRMFDICIYFAGKPDPQYPQDLVAVVYECYLDDDGEYQTKTDTSWFIKDG